MRAMLLVGGVGIVLTAIATLKWGESGFWVALSVTTWGLVVAAIVVGALRGLRGLGHVLKQYEDKT